jgi:hypothetical protein
MVTEVISNIAPTGITLGVLCASKEVLMYNTHLLHPFMGIVFD